MGWNKSKFKGVNRPVESVSWYDCLDFIAKINAVGQIGVSLPTEAQWEHACRAGTTTPFHFGSSLNGDRANCNGSYPCGTEIKGRSRRETTPVGECQNPNAWGLYDMHGNVWEWCYDRYGTYGKAVTDPTGAVTGGARVCRGGCWKVGAQNCRSSARQKCAADEKRDDVGLRLVWFAGPHGR